MAQVKSSFSLQWKSLVHGFQWCAMICVCTANSGAGSGRGCAARGRLSGETVRGEENMLSWPPLITRCSSPGWGNEQLASTELARPLHTSPTATPRHPPLPSSAHAAQLSIVSDHPLSITCTHNLLDSVNLSIEKKNCIGCRCKNNRPPDTSELIKVCQVIRHGSAGVWNERGKWALRGSRKIGKNKSSKRGKWMELHQLHTETRLNTNSLGNHVRKNCICSYILIKCHLFFSFLLVEHLPTRLVKKKKKKKDQWICGLLWLSSRLKLSNKNLLREIQEVTATLASADENGVADPPISQSVVIETQLMA